MMTRGLHGSGPAAPVIFTALFRPFEGAILRRAELQPAAYPFRPCAGDPLREPGPGAAEIC